MPRSASPASDCTAGRSNGQEYRDARRPVKANSGGVPGCGGWGARGQIGICGTEPRPYSPRSMADRPIPCPASGARAINVGVFLPNWIGDVVMATPTLRALREHYGPRVRLTGILRPYVADVLAGTSWLDEIMTYDRRARDAGLTSWALVRQLRSRQLDSVILLTNSLRTALIAWASGAPQRVGYVRYGRAPLLTDRLYAPREGHRFQPVSAVDYYLQLAYAVGVSYASRQLELATLPAHEEHAARLWRRYDLPQDGPVVVMSSGAAHGEAKRWPPEYFAQLARRVAAELSAPVLLLCGPADRESADRIQQLADCDHVHSLADEVPSIGLSKAIIRRCQLLVTNDSGPRHLAAAFQVPSIALFGPTDPRWSENYNIQELQLRQHVPCGPCGRRHCPLLHHRCMRELTVDRVFDGVAGLLRRVPSRAVA